MFKTLLLAGAALRSPLRHQPRTSRRSASPSARWAIPSSSPSSRAPTDEAKQINPGAKVTIASADYDLNKQLTQIDNFIAAGVDMILFNPADPKAIAPAIKRAQAAGITVIGVDVAAAGADATVQTQHRRPERSPANTSPTRSTIKATSSSRTGRRSPR